MKNENISFGKLLNELTLQIFADRYNLKLKVKEQNKETLKERIYTIILLPSWNPGKR